MKKYILISFLLCSCSLLNAADIRGVSLSRCEQDALTYSYGLKELRQKVISAEAEHKSINSSYYPSLYFDAKGSWVSQVPELELGPVKAEFGDNWGYSVGPTLEYLLFDYGGRAGMAKAANAALSAAQDELAFASKTVVLDVRRAYFTVQQDLERMYFMAQQLKVAQKQLRDVNSAFKAGAKSRLDVSMALRQELRAQVNVSAARGALGAHLRELFTLTGSDYGIDPSYPADWRIDITKDDKPASSRVKADSLEETVKKFMPFGSFTFDENSSKLAALDNMAGYYLHLADSYKSSLYPTVALSGGAYWEYPNGPITEDVFLGRAGISLRMPLFEGSKSKSKAKAQESQSRAVKFQRLDVEDTLKKLFSSSKSLLYSLDLQSDLTKKMIDASAKTAGLTYDAYNAGSVTFLEVDNANLGLLESQIALADIYIETLNRLAVLDNLGKGN